jgi:hypothetical protein
MLMICAGDQEDYKLKQALRESQMEVADLRKQIGL